MKRKGILVLLAIIFIFSGCSKQEEIFYLDDKYYGANEYIEASRDDIENNSGNYLLFIYNSTCGMGVSCEEIFQDFMAKYNVSIVSISFLDFKETYLYEEVKYAPSVLVIKNKKVVAYLDANKDEDLDKYQDVEKFKEWIKQYIFIEK